MPIQLQGGKIDFTRIKNSIITISKMDFKATNILRLKNSKHNQMKPASNPTSNCLKIDN